MNPRKPFSSFVNSNGKLGALLRKSWREKDSRVSETLKTLMEQLHHPDKNVRSPAVLKLGDLRETEALSALLNTVGTEPDFYVREDITWALVRIGDAAVLPLITL